MNQRSYLLLQLLVIREYKSLIEARLRKHVNNNVIMKHWCKRHAARFREYVTKNKLID